MGVITITYCLLLVLWVDTGNSQVAPEDQPVLDALTQLGLDTERLGIFINNVLVDQDKLEALMSRIDDISPYQTIACDACMVLVDTINLFLDGNGTYEEVREDAIALCNDTLYVAGYNKSHIMCPGIIDLYAPHLLEILRIKPMESDEVCSRLNFCEQPVPYKDNSFGANPHYNQHSRQEIIQLSEDDVISSGNDVKQTTFKIAQINDLHIDPEYEEGAATDCGYLVCCRRRFEGQGSAGKIGAYTCNSNPNLIYEILEEIERINPDFILYLGDNPPHSIWEETLEKQNNETIRAVDMIAEKISSKKTYPAIANHETFPTNLYYTPRPEVQTLNSMLVAKWPTISPLGQEQLATIQKAAYYSIPLKPGLRLLSYNSNYGYTYNFYTLLIHDPDEPVYTEMKQFMDSTLTQAQANGEKVILIGHHPLGNIDSQISHAQWLTDLVLRFQDIIVLHVHGHTHRDGFKLFVDANDNTAKSVAFVSPSVTTFTNYNPAFRVYTMDSNTFQVLDYEQYYVPIQEGNNATIKVSYTAKNEYQLSDMSPQSWYTLSQRLESDPDVLARYRRNTYTKSDKESPCEDATCKYETVCGVRNTVYTRYAQCVDANTPTTTEPPVTLNDL